MKIADAVELATGTTKKVLEDMVRTHRGEWNFGAMITCYRGDEPVVMLVLPPNRTKVIQAAMVAGRGYGPDLLAMTHDSFVVSVPWREAKDPRTGEPWGVNPDGGPGPMQTYVEEFGYDGTVLDALITHVVNRAGDAKVVPRPYAVDGREVKWLTDIVPDNSQYSDDGVQDALLYAMTEETLDQVLATDMPDWAAALMAKDPERARWVYDMITTTFIENELGSDVTVALFARKGSPRDQMLRSRFPRSQVLDPSRWN